APHLADHTARAGVGGRGWPPVTHTASTAGDRPPVRLVLFESESESASGPSGMTSVIGAWSGCRYARLVHVRPSVPTWSRHLRREHRVFGAEWARAAADPTGESLRSLAERLIAHLEDEQRRIHPLVDRHLPIGTGTLDAVRDEHATFVSLVDLLNRRLAGQDSDSVAVIVHDIEQLWRAHVRRFDRVIGPVLRHLDAGKGPA
ncbi:MAG TPA: hemerythrin domain-containing protein, partial [Pseudomonadales bacterium]|nr:hemerythrin domain-containing protein [Pseudomonadales bacterium]